MMNRKNHGRSSLEDGREKALYLSFSHTSFSEQNFHFHFCTGPANYVVGRVNSAEEVEEKREGEHGFIVSLPAKVGRLRGLTILIYAP